MRDLSGCGRRSARKTRAVVAAARVAMTPATVRTTTPAPKASQTTATPVTTASMMPTMTGDPDSQWVRPTRLGSCTSANARCVIVMACDKVRLQLRCELEVGMPEPVHADHQPGVLDIGLNQAEVRSHANE